jgi:hypothetical protein
MKKGIILVALVALFLGLATPEAAFSKSKKSSKACTEACKDTKCCSDKAEKGEKVDKTASAKDCSTECATKCSTKSKGSKAEKASKTSTKEAKTTKETPAPSKN